MSFYKIIPPRYTIYFHLFLTEVQLMCNVVPTSAVERSNSVIHPDPQNLRKCYMLWQNGVRVANGIRMYNWPSDRKIILDDLAGSSVITSVLKMWKWAGAEKAIRVIDCETHPLLLALWPLAKACGWPLEAEMIKEKDSSLESPGRTQPCQHLDFNLGASILNFWMAEPQDRKCCFVPLRLWPFITAAMEN